MISVLDILGWKGIHNRINDAAERLNNILQEFKLKLENEAVYRNIYAIEQDA